MIYIEAEEHENPKDLIKNYRKLIPTNGGYYAFESQEDLEIFAKKENIKPIKFYGRKLYHDGYARFYIPPDPSQKCKAWADVYDEVRDATYRLVWELKYVPENLEKWIDVKIGQHDICNWKAYYIKDHYMNENLMED